MSYFILNHLQIDFEIISETGFINMCYIMETQRQSTLNNFYEQQISLKVDLLFTNICVVKL